MRNMLMKMNSWSPVQLKKKKIPRVANEHLFGCISYIPIEVLAFACTLCICPFLCTLCPPCLRVLSVSVPATIPGSICVTVSWEEVVVLRTSPGRLVQS